MDYPLVHNYTSCSHFADARGQFMMESFLDSVQTVGMYSGLFSVAGFLLSRTSDAFDHLRSFPRDFLVAGTFLSPFLYGGARLVSKMSKDVANHTCTKASKEFESFEAFARYQKEKFDETRDIF